MTAGTERRPRLAVALPYWAFWEASVPGDLGQEKRTLLEGVVQTLQAGVEVVLHTVIASRSDAEQLAKQVQNKEAEALLVLQTMAVPPSYVDAALKVLPAIPLILWAVGSQEPLGSDFDHAAITAEGATVGVPMLTNLLVRRGRQFHLVFGRLGDASVVGRIFEAVTAAAAAFRIGRSRLGRVGQAPDGYDCVELDAQRLRLQTGITVVQIEPAEVRDSYEQVSDSHLEAIRRETELLYLIDPDARGDSLERSLRLACAMDELVVRHRLNAGAMNCHVAEIRFGEPIAITPCFALGRLTSAGIPWSCAGDLLTAVAMLCLKRLGGAALYHEVEALDPATGEFVLANTGEHDLAFAGKEPALITKNGWFSRDAHCGVCVKMSPPSGPATLVGFTELDVPGPQYRLIAAEGDFSPRGWPAISTPSASFRFKHAIPSEAWSRWCGAGVNHHSAATPGDYLSSLEMLAVFLGLDLVRV